MRGPEVFIGFSSGLLPVFFLQRLLFAFLFNNLLLRGHHGLLSLLQLLSCCLLLSSQFGCALASHGPFVRLLLSIPYGRITAVRNLRLGRRLLLIVCVLSARLLSLLLIGLLLLISLLLLLIGLLLLWLLLLWLLLLWLLLQLLLLIGLELLLIGLLLLVRQGLLLRRGLRLIGPLFSSFLVPFLGMHAPTLLGRTISLFLRLRLLLILRISLLLILRIRGRLRLLIPLVIGSLRRLGSTCHASSVVTRGRVVHGCLSGRGLRGCRVAGRRGRIIARNGNGTAVVSRHRVVAALSLQIVKVIVPVSIVRLRLVALKAAGGGLDQRGGICSRT